MTYKINNSNKAISAAFMALLPGQVLAQENDLLQSLGGDQMFSLAVGYEQPISEAPAVATVITAKDIEALGATRIEEVLATVTGLHISKNRAHDSIYVIRSITSEVNPHVLVMINGAPIGDAVQGGRPLGWTLPVQNISRIEIVRGPGSALYGADAFAGTINIITKTAQEIGPISVGALGGSFSTYGGWIQSGIVRDSFEAALSFEVQTTNGDDPIVQADVQTFLDQLFSTNASLAPGGISLGRTDINARSDFRFGDSFTWRAAYQGIIDAQNGAGVAFALDPVGERDLHLFSSDLTFETALAENLEMMATASFFREDFKAFFQSNPPGAFGFFPEGVLNQIDFDLTEYRGRTEILYAPGRSHKLKAGFGATYQEAANIVDRRNFLQGPGGVLLPAPGFLTTDELGVLPNAFADSRTNVFGLLQDEWSIAPDWTVTLGVRFDHFTNFGLTINPRASVVWNANPTFTIKALYGSAFRAPTFLEETEGSGQIARGNQDLEPEMIDTAEIVLEKRWSDAFETSVTGYAYWTNDLIEVVSSPMTGIPTFENTGGTRGAGFELDGRLNLNDKVSVRTSYAYQSAEFRASGQRVGSVPQHLMYAEARWMVTPELSSLIGVKYVGNRSRAASDIRPTLNGYALANLSLEYRPRQLSGLFVRVAATNLLNKRALEPSPNLIFPTDDIPLEGRKIIARIGVSR